MDPQRSSISKGLSPTRKTPMGYGLKIVASLTTPAERPLREHEPIWASHTEVVNGHDQRNTGFNGCQMHCRSQRRIHVVYMDDVWIETGKGVRSLSSLLP
jgi:hypothetical protein